MTNLQMAISELTSTDKQQLVINKIKRRVYVNRGNGIMYDVLDKTTVKNLTDSDLLGYTRFWLGVDKLPTVGRLIQSSDDSLSYSHLFSKVNGWKVVIHFPDLAANRLRTIAKRCAVANDISELTEAMTGFNGRYYFLTDSGNISSVSILEHLDELTIQ